MANEITSVVSLQIDVSKAIISVAGLNDVLNDLKGILKNVGSTVSKALNPTLSSFQKLLPSITKVSTAFSDLADSMGEAMTPATTAQDAGGLLQGITAAYNGVVEFIDKMEKAEKYSGKIQSLFADVVTAPNISNFLNSLLPKSTELFSTVSSWVNNDLLGTISVKLQENGGKLGTAATNMLSSITGAFQKVGGALGGMSLGWGAAIGGIIAVIVLLVQNWDTVSAKAQEVWGFIQGLFAQFDDFLKNIFAKDFTEQFGAFGHVLNAFFANVENVWNAVKSIFGGIVDFVKNVFAGDWGAAWDSIVGVFKGVWDLLVSIVKVPINGIIGLINMLIASIYSGIADVVNGIGSIISGVGSLLGLDWGFSIPTTPPQIPYLAKGAVLPANRPFLAVVGDQRHGTNVEAPLATIQEAVALVLEDHIGAMMAGFEALLKEQQATRRTIEGIEIGDAVIGRAAERYGRKMAVVRGGY